MPIQCHRHRNRKSKGAKRIIMAFGCYVGFLELRGGSASKSCLKCEAQDARRWWVWRTKQEPYIPTNANQQARAPPTRTKTKTKAAPRALVVLFLLLSDTIALLAFCGLASYQALCSFFGLALGRWVGRRREHERNHFGRASLLLTLLDFAEDIGLLRLE